MKSATNATISQQTEHAAGGGGMDDKNPLGFEGEEERTTTPGGDTGSLPRALGDGILNNKSKSKLGGDRVFEVRIRARVRVRVRVRVT